MRNLSLVLSLIVAFMIPWEGVIRTDAFGNGSKLMGFALAAVWFATVAVTGRIRKPVPFHFILFLFVLWNLLSVFWSADPQTSLSQAMTWVQLLILALVSWDLYTTETAVIAGLQAYVLGAYVAIGGAIANFFSGFQFYTHYDRYSPGETNPDGFGIVMAIGVPIAWYLAVRQSNNKIGNVLKVVNYVYIPAAMLGIALSGTRTAMVASMLGMLFGLSSMTRIRLSTRIAIFVFITLVVLALLPQLQGLKSFQRLSTTASEITDGDLNNRTNIWLEGFEAFAEHPILGIGSNMYPTINSWGKAAHNTFLSILVEVGLVGFLLYCLLVAIVFYQTWKQPKWHARFWLTVLCVWGIGASTLSWGHRKPSWSLFNLAIASGAIASRREQPAPLGHDDIAGSWLPHPIEQRHVREAEYRGVSSV